MNKHGMTVEQLKEWIHFEKTVRLWFLQQMRKKGDRTEKP